jgi:uridine phosphorylase
VRAVPRHLNPHAEVAERVLLPGDPGRALRLAQWLVDGPKMLNHHRGLWGYTGPAPDGRPLTIQSTGTGGPSAAVVLEELAELGARRVVRVGTARALPGGPPVGTLVVAEAVLGEDGASRALGAPPRQPADPGLARALAAALGAEGVLAPIASADLVHPLGGDGGAPSPAGAVAVDLESAAVLAVAARHGLRAACVVAITSRDAVLIEPAALAAAEETMGRAALAALRA